MKIEVNLERKYVISSLIIGLVLVGFVGVYAYNSQGTGGNPAVFGHSVDEMNWTKRIPMINATMICINEDCKVAWPSGGGGSQWTTSGSDIYYAGGVWTMGLGIAGNVVLADHAYSPSYTPPRRWSLTASGNITSSDTVKGTKFCIGSDCISIWPSGGSSLPTGCSPGAVVKLINNVWSCGTDGNCGVSGTCSQICIGSSCKNSWPIGVGDISCASGQAVVRITNGVPICGPSDTNRYWRYKGDSKIFFCGPTNDNRFTQCNNLYHNGYYYVCYNNKLTMVDKIATCGSNTLCNDLAAGTVCSYVYSATNQGTALSQNFCGYTQNHMLSYQTTGFYVCE